MLSNILLLGLSFAATINTDKNVNLKFGQSISCLSSNPIGVNIPIYRYLGKEKNSEGIFVHQVSRYPDPEIAESWDKNWNSKFTEIDCTGVVQIADMSMNPLLTFNPSRALKCKGDKDGVYRYIGGTTVYGYASMEIADSWDADWHAPFMPDLREVDCTGMDRRKVITLKQEELFAKL